MDWLVLAVSLLVILAGAELFTNGVEWIGEGFGLSEGAVGSVLAAVGTALPETLLPLVAILSGHRSGEEIGIGAILGAPFMLTTLAMVVIAVAVLVNARGGRRPAELEFDRRVLRQDLGYFLVMYSLAVIAGLLDVKAFDVLLAIVLVIGYVYYVRRHFQSPGEPEIEKESQGEIKALYVWRWLALVKRGLAGWTKDRSTLAPFVQVVVALVAIIGGARLFITAVDGIAERFHVPTLAFTLLVAPVATELPEKFNSVIWIRRRKDTLALGNMTGAMVFQSSFPVTIGLLLTPWKLAHEALVAAAIALLAGAALYATVRFRGRLTARLLLLQGIFYVCYVAYVATKF
ncbi:MAG: sodium:calcium antiporter [Actinobacteria bacterium]|nr:sodium:calcium antiporter [Actinomycetota bacterium]